MEFLQFEWMSRKLCFTYVKNRSTLKMNSDMRKVICIYYLNYHKTTKQLAIIVTPTLIYFELDSINSYLYFICLSLLEI